MHLYEVSNSGHIAAAQTQYHCIPQRGTECYIVAKIFRTMFPLTDAYTTIIKEGRKERKEERRRGKEGRQEGRNFSFRLKITTLYKITINKTFIDKFSSYCHCSCTLNLFLK